MKNDEKKFFVYIDGFVGNLGTKILIENQEKVLLKHFNKAYIDKVHKECDEVINIEGGKKSSFVVEKYKRNSRVVELFDIPYIICDFEEINKGGVLTALWKLCERKKMGLKYRLCDIPILQGTIEIANFFNINPYRLFTKNAQIYLLKEDISDKLDECYGINMIGITNNEKRRVRADGEVESYLVKDFKDELYKIENSK